MTRTRPKCLLTALVACVLLVGMAGSSAGQQDRQEPNKQDQKRQNKQESYSERSLDRHSAEDIAKRMRERDSSLKDAVTKAERETNGIAIEAQALILNKSEFQRIKGRHNESDKAASQNRETQDRDRESASSKSERGSDKLVIETLCASQGNVELTAVIPETGEVLHLGSAPGLLGSRGLSTARRTSETENKGERNQEPGRDQEDRRNMADRRTERMQSERESGSLGVPTRIAKANSVIGAKIKNHQGESLGKIEDIAIDHERGRIAYAVVGFGGFLGIGEKLFAVPWHALEENQQGVYILRVSKEDLKNAPGFDKDNWPDMANQHWGAEVHSFYNTTPYWEKQGASPQHASTGEFGRNVTSAEIRQVERFLQQSDYKLPKAIDVAEKRTNGKAIFACAKLVSDQDFDRGMSGDVPKEQRDANRSKNTRKDQASRSTDRPHEEREAADRDQHFGRDGGDRPDHQERGAADRDQHFGQERLIIEVACLVSDDSGNDEFKKVIVNPQTGEVTNERRMNSLDIDPFYTRVVSAARR